MVTSRRRRRLRTTEPPTWREIAKPTSGTGTASPTMTVNGPRRTRVPLAANRLNVRRPRSGRVVDPIGVVAETGPQAERRERPLARRALSTARPPAVAIRARKPCFFALRRAFGWNVRFTETSEMWPCRMPGERPGAHGAEPENDSSGRLVPDSAESARIRRHGARSGQVRRSMVVHRGATVPAADVRRPPVFPPGSQK